MALIRSVVTLLPLASATLIFSGNGRIKITDNNAGGTPRVRYFTDSSMTNAWEESGFPENPFSISCPIEIWADNPNTISTKTITVWNWF